MHQLVWIIVYFILEQLQQPVMPALSVKRDCVLSPFDRISRRQAVILLGPKKTPTYNPYPGYEPYWAGGDWVFDRFDITTEKPEGSICGENCPDLYTRFGEVCGRNINYIHKTFKDYCALLDEDCTGRSKWLIAYRGKCQDNLKTYPTKHDLMVTRAEEYLSNFFEENPTPARRKG